MTKRGGSRWYILLLPLFFAVSCSDESLSLFFDIPPPTAQEKAAEAAAKQAEAKAKADAEAAAAGQAGGAAAAEDEGERPEIEAILDWEKASEMLPKDDFDEVDWVAALRDGTINPRRQIAGQPDPQALLFK